MSIAVSIFLFSFFVVYYYNITILVGLFQVIFIGQNPNVLWNFMKKVKISLTQKMICGIIKG